MPVFEGSIKTRYCLVLILSLCWCAISCHSGSGNEPVYHGKWTPDFFGTVVDVRGKPVEGVEVHYIPHFSGGWQPSGLEKILPSVVFHFGLENNGIVSLIISRIGTHDEIARPVDQESMLAGEHSVTFDAGRLTNGVYEITLIVDGIVTEQRTMLLLVAPSVQYVNNLYSTAGITRTTMDGQFNLPHSVFGIGLSFDSFLVPFSILDTIDLVLTKPGHPPIVKQMIVDTLHIFHGNFTLQ